jgi:hypothetical protein
MIAKVVSRHVLGPKRVIEIDPRTDENTARAGSR